MALVAAVVDARGERRAASLLPSIAPVEHPEPLQSRYRAVTEPFDRSNKNLGAQSIVWEALFLKKRGDHRHGPPGSEFSPQATESET